MQQMRLFTGDELNAYYPEDYVIQSRNRMAYETIVEDDSWNVIILHGIEGSGKTHLSHVWMHNIGAELLNPSNFLESSYRSSGFIIEDIHNEKNESALLHCYNYLMENKIRLLMTSSIPPETIKFKIKDLSSRICSAFSIEIYPPDEELMKIALVKHFVQKQLLVDVCIINKIIEYLPCSMRILRKFLLLLDEESYKTRVTKSLMLSIAQKVASGLY